jgi:hypothetical protein
MTNQKVLMNGNATVNLMAYTQNSERFKALLHSQTIIDAKLSFLTLEGETITVDVLEFLQLEWKTCCAETGEELEEELIG